MNVGFKREPVAWTAAIAAALNCAVGFGLNVTPAQMALLNTALGTIGGLIIRQNVYAPVTAEGAPIIVPGKPAPVDPETAVAHVGQVAPGPAWTEKDLLAEYSRKRKEVATEVHPES
jgi:hypothetical protein